MMSITLIMSRQTQEISTQEIPKIFLCIFVVKISLLLTVYRTLEGGGLKAEDTK
jgi:hypothetical protein